MQPLIIDTREKFEFAASNVKGAVNIPPAKFLAANLPPELESLPKDSKIIVYCRTGSRSNVVSHILRTRGFTNIVNGINEQQVKRLLDK